MKHSTLLLLTALIFGACQSTDSNTSTQKPNCDTVINIEGVYNCTGECVVTGDDGIRRLVKVSGETDRVKRFSDESEHLYQVDITGNNDFQELEIGALSGRTLYTATAEVSDGQFPVLEEYIFDTDASCKAVGFTKIVRNPDSKLFKACAIYCKKK